MDPLTGIGAGLTGISALSKFLTGNKQGQQAGQLRNQVRPNQEVQGEYAQNVTLARNMGMMGLPGANVQRSQNDRILSGTVSAASKYGSSPAQILAAISGASGRAMDEEAGLTEKRVKQDFENKKLQMKTNKALGERKHDAWKYNEAKPYDDDMAAASALNEASIKNKHSALDTLAKIPLLFA